MKYLIRGIDNLLNSITMYRLLLYGLSLLLVIAVIFSYTGVLASSGGGVLAVTGVLLTACYLTNKLLGYIYSAATNSESYLITALILACILPPSTTAVRLSYVALAGVIAIASKFVLAYRHKHIFNPVAVGAICLTLLDLLSVTWWIGNPSMLPFVMLLGLLIIRKIHRFKMVIAFVLAVQLMLVLQAILSDQSAGLLIKNAVLSGPLVFFSAIMLSEPATMPSRQYYQILYGLLVGALYASQLRYGILSTSPHAVLLAGNIFAYVVNPKYKVRLKLKEKLKISTQLYDYIFTPERPLTFTPGQYMEWTLPHKHTDGRGNRRTFTIASSPTESDIHMGVKFYQPSSSFKRSLMAMNPGDKLVAGQIAGDFVLPTDQTQKLVFIAGGIGITPFRSMVKYLTDVKQHRDIILLYMVNKAEELAYKDILRQSKAASVVTVPLIAAALSAELLQKYVPDYMERDYYISGPNGLVESYNDILRTAGFRGRIITDYFSGY